MKKYLTGENIFAILFFAACAFVSGAFLHYSYVNAEYGPEWFIHLMRVGGFIGTVFFPCLLVYGVHELMTDEIIEDLERDYNALWQDSHASYIPDDADYAEEAE